MAAHTTPRSALYRTIYSEPAVVREVLATAGEVTERAGAIIAGAERVFLTGTGTSSHAAIVGEHLLRAVGVDAYATTNFDLATYRRPIGAGDVLIAISHRGSKRYGAAAIAYAKEQGTPVIGITGQGSPMAGPDFLLHTAPQEVSSTHTASYTGNLTALALLAERAGTRKDADVADLRAAIDRLPALLDAVLAEEDVVRAAADVLAARGRLVLAGAGPNAATAREGALKVKESSFLVAEGFELETLLHGGLQAIEAGDLAVVIAAHGPALPRTRDAARALRLIGARLLIVADERAVAELQDDAQGREEFGVRYGAVPEALSPILAAVPLQLLAAFTAEARGTDADSFRADDPVYKRANESYPL